MAVTPVHPTQPAAGEPAELPAFRRPTEADAVALAREMFLEGERVDMNAVAARLGVSRATLHRWVGTREHLLDRVLGGLAGEFFDEGLARARERPDDAIAELARALVAATSGFAPLRGFVAREPELALRLLLGDRGAVRRQVGDGIQALVEEVAPDEADSLRGFSDTLAQVGIAVEWATIVAGDEPSAERIAQIARALLVGGRAGELPLSACRGSRGQDVTSAVPVTEQPAKLP
ncbi:MAG TPA: QsdR family transcriptional regulator [Solirubrobacteraceae bacterium]|nr:QsdR family transcriptional regulator [Solirubrobacteraceae bacterium]